ncbi:hypothetical protein [Brumimicrobium mesophilum]|uniref:hypothetical protein n=1 Tax=Brumimicrobium mesophilum TaxID=392717 RepID=UPI000D1403C0|nr:hypothetical protein [Brumimicrobium mesophilum]
MLNIVFSSLIATALMTVASLIFSILIGTNYFIPTKINQFFFPNKDGFIPKLISWIIHFIIGYIFALIWVFIDSYISTENIIYDGLIYGVICGIMGMIGWRLIIGISNKKMEKFKLGYLLHIFLVHIVYSLALIYCLSSDISGV